MSVVQETLHENNQKLLTELGALIKANPVGAIKALEKSKLKNKLPQILSQGDLRAEVVSAAIQQEEFDVAFQAATLGFNQLFSHPGKNLTEIKVRFASMDKIADALWKKEQQKQAIAIWKKKQTYLNEGFCISYLYNDEKELFTKQHNLTLLDGDYYTPNKKQIKDVQNLYFFDMGQGKDGLYKQWQDVQMTICIAKKSVRTGNLLQDFENTFSKVPEKESSQQKQRNV